MKSIWTRPIVGSLGAVLVVVAPLLADPIADPWTYKLLACASVLGLTALLASTVAE